MSKKLIATRVFYSYHGKDINGLLISSGHGQTEEMGEISKTLTKEAKEHHNKVDSIHIIAITPLEFIEVDSE